MRGGVGGWAQGRKDDGALFQLFIHCLSPPCAPQIEISRSYGVVEWREDLKRLCRRAGADGKASVLLFSDTQIKAEAFVEDINNLLNVPNMFPSDERAAIGEQVRVEAKKAGKTLETPQVGLGHEQW